MFKPFFILIGILNLAYLVSAQDKKNFIINGNLKGLKSNTILYLIHNIGGGKVDTISQTKAKNDSFLFTGTIPIEGEFYFIKIDTIQVKYDKPPREYLRLLMVSSPMSIKGSLADLSIYNVKIAGSTSHQDYVEYSKIMDSLVRGLNYVLNENKFIKREDTISIDKYLQKIRDIEKSLIVFKKQWIIEHSRSFFTPWIMSELLDSLTFLEKAYFKLSNRVKKGKYAIELKRKIDVAQRTSIGKVAPEFPFLTLSEIVKNNKLTLLDFWASWCHPCRASFPYLKELYHEYKSKGFNIVSVSIDKDSTAWKKAIREEAVPWLNIRDYNGNIRELYGINSVPQTYLLNEQGKIIAKGIYKNELKKMVAIAASPTGNIKTEQPYD